jgi:hypothetical protein
MRLSVSLTFNDEATVKFRSPQFWYASVLDIVRERSEGGRSSDLKRVQFDGEILHAKPI